VRWFVPGPLGTAARERFGRFPARAEVLADAYLVCPCLDGLSVKGRAPGRPLVEAGCMAELTEANADGTRFWTVGLEASGPVSLLLPRRHWREDQEELGRPVAG